MTEFAPDPAESPLELLAHQVGVPPWWLRDWLAWQIDERRRAEYERALAAVSEPLRAGDERA